MISQRTTPKAKGTRRARIVCTGGSGYLGSVLLPRLLDAGYDVVLIDVDDPPQAVVSRRSPGSLHFERCDVRDVDSSLVWPGDTIVHLAALSNDATFANDAAWGRSINVDATLRVAELARKVGANRFIFASSCSVYGAIGDVMVTEQSAVAGESAYARAKAECEIELAHILRDHVSLTALRFGTLFGFSPKMRFDLVVNRMTLSALQDRQVLVTGGGRQWRPLLHVGDAAAAIHCAAESASSNDAATFNVVGENQSIRALGEQVSRLLAVPMIVADEDAIDPRSYSADASLILDQLGVASDVSVAMGVQEVRNALVNGTTSSPDFETDSAIIDLRSSINEHAVGADA